MLPYDDWKHKCRCEMFVVIRVSKKEILTMRAFICLKASSISSVQ